MDFSRLRYCLTLDLVYPCHVSKLGGSNILSFEAILLWTARLHLMFLFCWLVFIFSYIFK